MTELLLDDPEIDYPEMALDDGRRHNNRPSRWPPAKFAQLLHWLSLGYSAARIAIEMGVSRGTVSGKLNREGLSTKGATECLRENAELSPRRRRKSNGERPEKPTKLYGRGGATVYGQSPQKPNWRASLPRGEATDIASEEPGITACSLFELDGTRCRWPYGDPGTPEFMFCGAVPVGGLPYCGCHAARAYKIS